MDSGMLRPLLIAFLLLPTLAIAQKERPLVFAHYMPWYASKPFSGSWGWHWTMDRFDPDAEPPSIASHDPPLMGPYDSGDPRAVECHVALMRLAGIDGVIVDWYGVSGFRDYAAIHRNTCLLANTIRRAGMQWAICYEDQTIGHTARELSLSPEEAFARGRSDLAWLRANAFSDPNYLRIGDRPLLAVFGPQYFDRPAWTRLLSDAGDGDPTRPRPLVVGLPHVAAQTGLEGVMSWPPVHGGRTVEPAEWMAHMRQVAADKSTSEGLVVATAFPGFRDIYREAGVGESYGFIDDYGGRTLAASLDLAMKSGASVVQIATWNDHGEETVIEPTINRGYSRLEIVKHATRAPASAEDLRLPVRVYELRLRLAESAEASEKLTRASELLLDGNIDVARAMVSEVEQ